MYFRPTKNLVLLPITALLEQFLEQAALSEGLLLNKGLAHQRIETNDRVLCPENLNAKCLRSLGTAALFKDSRLKYSQVILLSD